MLSPTARIDMLRHADTHGELIDFVIKDHADHGGCANNLPT